MEENQQKQVAHKKHQAEEKTEKDKIHTEMEVKINPQRENKRNAKNKIAELKRKIEFAKNEEKLEPPKKEKETKPSTPDDETGDTPSEYTHAEW